ncbi:MAG: protein kinase [Mycoplasmataceae bacterium]|nr:protein kinase [Mycoplasmataceae bacterium]
MEKNKIIINEQYEVIKKIGEGASAKVYEAIDLKTNHHVALKVEKIDTEFSNAQKRFEMEAKLLKNIHNPNIINVFDYFVWKKQMIIVMEILEGKTLDELIQEQGSIDSKQLVQYAIDILKALVELHRMNIMHRDLKPQNVMIGVDNNVKLMDFGIIQTSIEQDLTREGAIIGTIEYLAPEILRGEKATEQTDIYSVGIILYKMATGIVPFKIIGDTKGTAMLILEGNYEDPSRYNPNINRELEQIIKWFIEKNFLERPRTSLIAIEKLQTYLTPKRTKEVLEPVINNKNNAEPIVENFKKLIYLSLALVLGLAWLLFLLILLS